MFGIHILLTNVDHFIKSWSFVLFGIKYKSMFIICCVQEVNFNYIHSFPYLAGQNDSSNYLIGSILLYGPWWPKDKCQNIRDNVMSV